MVSTLCGLRRMLRFHGVDTKDAQARRVLCSRSLYLTSPIPGHPVPYSDRCNFFRNSDSHQPVRACVPVSFACTSISAGAYFVFTGRVSLFPKLRSTVYELRTSARASSFVSASTVRKMTSSIFVSFMARAVASESPPSRSAALDSGSSSSFNSHCVPSCEYVTVGQAQGECVHSTEATAGT